MNTAERRPATVTSPAWLCVFLVACLCIPVSLSVPAQTCGYLSFQQADTWATSPRARTITWDGTRFLTTISTTLFTSPDGLHWSGTDTGCEWPIDSIVGDGRVWVAQTFYGLARSTDGTTFTPTVFPSSGCSLGLSHHGDYFFTGCNAGLYASRDGLQWVPLPVSALSPDTVTYGNGLYVVAGEGTLLSTSTDLSHWNIGYFPSSVTTLAFENGAFVASGPDAVLASTDGKVWQTAKVPPARVLAHGGGRFLDLTMNKFYTSTDGFNWTELPFQGYFQFPYSITYAAGRFVATSEQGILTTVDGSVWQALWTWAGTYQLPLNSPRFQINAQRFSAVVGHFGSPENYWALRLSEDGKVWIESPIQPLAQNTGFSKGAASDGNGQWVVVGTQGQNGAWASSTNLVSWSSGSIPDMPALSDVAYGAGRYVAVGLGGAIATSTDGTHWSAVASPTTAFLSRIVHGHGKFFALGGAWLESEDGLNWNLWALGGGGLTDFSVLPFGFSMWDFYAGLSISYDGVAWLQVDPQVSVHSALYPWMGHYVASGGSIPGQQSPGQLIVTDDFTTWSYLYSNLRFPPESLASDGSTLVMEDSAFASGCFGPGLVWNSPFTGPGQGGNSVTVTGVGLSACDAVYFGDTPAISFTIDSDTQITAIAPPFAGVDTVRISVHPRGNFSRLPYMPYTYLPDPVVTNFAPTVFSTAGYQRVSIAGHGFGTNPGIGLGAEVLPMVYQTVLAGGVTGISQPLPAGTYDLTVARQDGPSVTIPRALTYADPPAIILAAFQDGPQRLTVVGYGFDAGSLVQIDGLPLSSTKFKTSRKLVAPVFNLKKLLPKGKPHAISVVNPNGLVSAPFTFKR